MLSDSVGACAAASAAGATCEQLPASPEALVSLVFAHALGLGESEWESEADAALLHLGSGSAESLEAILEHARLPNVAPRLYLVLLLAVDDSLEYVERSATAPLSELRARLRPPQSYSVGGGGDSSTSRLLLAVHLLEGVVRRDDAQQATSAEVAACGARGLTHACHLLAEVACKIGKATKFGA